MFDVSHMLAVDVRGAGARDFLRYALANDVARLNPGKALYSCMLAEDGGVLDDLIVYARAGGDFRLVVNAGTAEKDLAWLEREVRERGADATLEPRRDLAIVAVQGPQAREKFWAARPATRAATESLRNFEAAEVDGRLRRAHRLYGRRRLRGHGAGGCGRGAVARAGRRGRRARGPRGARYAAARSGHESLRPGHGRDA